jgi:hypothetical protein
LLKNRDKVTTEGMKVYLMALEKEVKKNQCLSQEIIGTFDEVCLVQETEESASEWELTTKGRVRPED